MKVEKDLICITRGKGASLYDDNGKEYIDAISSWWVNIHGHSHPYIIEKMYEQMKQLEHVLLAGFTHMPAITLSENLLSVLPKNQKKIFFSDDGSTAVEVALKMSLQYWSNQNKKKKKIIALKNAYHGDTFGAMSVSARDNFTKPFKSHLFPVLYLDVPQETNCQKVFNRLHDLTKMGQRCCIHI